MISTVIDKSLGLEFPIFQGGMAWVADASLAAGVSNAGGLGLIAAMNSNGEQLRAEIKKCKDYAYESVCRRGGSGCYRRGHKGYYNRRRQPR